MALAGVAGSFKRPHPGARGSILLSGGRAEGRAFNNLPQIIARFPRELSAIVDETTDDLGILSVALAPVQASPRPGDPVPGTLKASEVTKIYLRGSDTVHTGKVTFTATDRRKHRYAKPVETGSYRVSRAAHGVVTVKAHPFLVDALTTLRPVFIERIAALLGNP